MSWFLPHPPRYRQSRQAPPKANTGMLPSLWCFLVGNQAVCYRRKGGTDGVATVTAPPRQWTACAEPAYQTLADPTVDDSGDTGAPDGCSDEQELPPNVV